MASELGVYQVLVPAIAPGKVCRWPLRKILKILNSASAVRYFPKSLAPFCAPRVSLSVEWERCSGRSATQQRKRVKETSVESEYQTLARRAPRSCGRVPAPHRPESRRFHGRLVAVYENSASPAYLTYELGHPTGAHVPVITPAEESGIPARESLSPLASRCCQQLPGPRSGAPAAGQGRRVRFQGPVA